MNREVFLWAAIVFYVILLYKKGTTLNDRGMYNRGFS